MGYKALRMLSTFTHGSFFLFRAALGTFTDEEEKR